jgi:hypothetical protein
MWMYFGEFISCSQPNVYESTKKYLIEANDPDNDLSNLFPVISFLDYSQKRPWPDGLPSVPFSDITCHFAVRFGHAKDSTWLHLPVTPIPLNGDCNEKFRQMYKRITGNEDETLSKTQHLICPDMPNLPLMGGDTDCKGDEPCSYYNFRIYNHFGSTAHCNPINIERIVVSISYINPKLSVNDFHNPWSYEIDTEWTTLSQTQSQILVINHFYTTLETDARRFGLRELSTTEKKLMRNPVVRIDKSPYLNLPEYPYL